MRERIENNLLIEVDGVDLTTLSNLEFYVKQYDLFFQYTPEVRSANEMTVTIPFEDAKKLQKTSAELQFAFTDATGRPDASEPVSVRVRVLLKEAGYDPA